MTAAASARPGWRHYDAAHPINPITRVRSHRARRWQARRAIERRAYIHYSARALYFSSLNALCKNASCRSSMSIRFSIWGGGDQQRLSVGGTFSWLTLRKPCPSPS